MKKPAKKRASNPDSHAENSRNRVRQRARRKQAGRQKPNGLTNGMERLRATIEASVDCVITIDAQSTILEFNAAAERTFGYAREDVIGKPLPEMIIPPSLREAHRRGMAALLKGGTGKLLGRRVEMPAMRSDSSEFPVELTITRIDSQKPPLFTAYLRDITERKRAEEALRKSEKLFTAFMDHLPGYAWIKDAEGRYVYINETFLQLRNAVGQTDAELWPAEIASTYRTNDNQVIQTKNALQTIEPFPKDPEHGCQIVSKFPIFDQDGAVVMVGGASVDISELVQAEKELDAQALRYKTLMETSTDSIYVVDAEGNLQEANAAFLRQRGYTAAEVKSLNIADWDAQWDREQIQERIRKLGDGSSIFETRHRSKDGSVFDVEICATSVRINGDRLLVCVARDITERKRDEGALRREKEILAKIFNNIPVMIGFVGLDGGVKLANPEWERTLGWTLKELRDQDVDIFAEAYPDLSYRQEVLDFVAAATGEWADLKIKVRDGRVINAACAVVRLSDGTKVAIAQDVTERKRAAEQLEEANRQLRILSRQLFHIQEEERRHLARELHDEIGQTLTAAKINLKIIAPDVPAEISGRFADSVQLLDRLLRQVRELSLNLRPPLLDELGLMPTLRWLVDQQAQRAGLRVSFNANVDGLEIEPEVQTTCFRVAQEALTNIIRHSGAKNVAVELRQEMERLTLRVRDDGAGFDPAVIQQRTAPDFTLGLVSMKERALLVRGGFEVHSAPGQGTEIRAWFPLPFEKPAKETA